MLFLACTVSEEIHFAHICPSLCSVSFSLLWLPLRFSSYCCSQNFDYAILLCVFFRLILPRIHKACLTSGLMVLITFRKSWPLYFQVFFFILFLLLRFQLDIVPQIPNTMSTLFQSFWSLYFVLWFPTLHLHIPGSLFCLVRYDGILTQWIFTQVFLYGIPHVS